MILLSKIILGKEEKEAVLKVMDSGQLARGAVIKEFEDRFAEFIGVKHAIATSNGTTALHTALVANGIGPGDEVITSPFSFIASANAIKMAGARPIFVDIEEKTANINPRLIPDAITQRTKAIMPVHLYGRPAKMGDICGIAEKYGLKVVEDACQAHGAEFNGKRVGSFGTGCFSFYATKNMMTGEGGMISTNDDEVAAIARMHIHHGSSGKYRHEMLGYNYRMSSMEAAIGLEQLKKLNHFSSRRRDNARYLSENLQLLKGIVVPEICSGHVFHQYTVMITEEFGRARDDVKNCLFDRDIASDVFYPIPIHKQRSYKEYWNDHFPVAEKLSTEVLSLPVHPLLTEKDLDKIIGALHEL